MIPIHGLKEAREKFQPAWPRRLALDDPRIKPHNAPQS